MKFSASFIGVGGGATECVHEILVPTTDVVSFRLSGRVYVCVSHC